MRVDLRGATALVTGASSGIGRAIACELAPRVKALALVARRRDRLEELRKELAGKHPALAVHVLPCDLADRAGAAMLMEAIVSQVGAVDVLVNNAGLADAGAFAQSDWVKTRQVLDVNVVALTFLTHKLLPPMIERGRGAILNVSSGFGLVFMPGLAAYVGAKHFVTGFTESLRLEARGRGVTVCQVCPGPVRTEFSQVAGVGPNLFSRLFGIGAEQCAREAVRGLERGRAMVFPGFRNRLMMWASRMTPRVVLRLVYGLASGLIARQLGGAAHD
jgi:hypothetical protein